MSLLSVTVKKARYVSIQGTQFNTYVTLKLQNVKSTTVTVKGSTPSWEQDFLFEINDINLGLLVEVWNKGVIWDRALGYHYLPLTAVAYEEQECGGRWIELEAQLMMRGGAVVGTTGPTGHALLLECRFEPPFDAEGTAGADLQRKLDLLNGALDAERAEQARRQMQYMAHSGYSEDSDYTSDLNYPVGQHPNCSASQFRNAAHQLHTPQRSLEVSRENSYERDEYHLHGDTDPLYYNSQPRTRIETWSQFQPELRAQASVESAISWRTAADWQSAEDQRRPSLERQNTLYDDIGYPFDTYTTSIRDAHLSQQPSYEEYFDSTSYAPYQTTYLGDDPRWQDRMYCEDSYGLMSTEFENIVNKRRSSVVQLPQVPQGQHSSRFSDFNGMAPYKPRNRRIAASLPATPGSTPRRGRSLPRAPGGSETGSVRSRPRRLPPTPATHVPYTTEAEKSFPLVSYGYDSYGSKTEYQDNITDHYQDTNYNTSYDEDGMQPFFDETPHATPPAAVQKTSWTETDTINQFTYPISHETDNIISKPLHKLPQPPVINQQEQYIDQNYQDYDQQYTDQNYEQYDETDQIIQNKPYQEQNENYLDQNYDLSYQSQQYEQQYEEQYQKNEYQETKYEIDQFQQEYQTNQQQYQDIQLNHQFKTNHIDQQQLQNTQQIQKDQFGQQHQVDQFGQQYQTDLFSQQHQKDLIGQQQLLDQQKKEPVQQLQTTMMTGAAALGSLMAGGAKKLGSFFGATTAAVAPPTAITQPQLPSVTSAPQLTPFTSSIAPVTLYTSSDQPITSASVPDVSPSIPVSTSSAPTLPRTPSLKRQESIIRPPIRKTRTLPEAPEDMSLSEFEEGVYEDDYNKTDYDRTSLDQYPDKDYLHDTIEEEDVNQTSPLQKTSPTRNGSVRKPSVDSYNSLAPSVIDRRTSQISYQNEDTVAVPTTQEESLTDKSKVTFKDDRTTYHEVPETNTFQQGESFDDQQEDYIEETDQFEDQDQEFHEEEDQYQEEEFPEKRPEIHKFKEEQPKLTPKQRWHRAYNKVIMQLNI